ncbi:hypothetical protein PHLH8_50850 [Pseudomonas sp. Pc102]|uniref:ATP-binding protein n=1 Tax=Pseudomonas sp. Pc102 TaxID=2678261 RepID=UPI001BCA99C8|nr:ATP-binding protein [Pseudomonas sp. Pc102]BBP85443.1 hypothetical protein PHLH8_50850 [Pseudomonas sp. Pc102]
MKDMYRAELLRARNLANDTEKFNYLNSVLRSILQVAALSTLEIVKRLTPSEDDDRTLDDFAARFLQPSDGLPVEVIDKLVPVVRSHIEPQFLKGWYERVGSSQKAFVNCMNEWVEFRNKKTGHGVVDQQNIREWAVKLDGFVEGAITVFIDALPTYRDQINEIDLDNRFNGMKVTTPLVWNGRPVVVIKVACKKGAWKLSGQVLSWDSADDFVVELQAANIFSSNGLLKTNRFKLADVVCENLKFSVFNNVPTRQTDTFEGRKKELDKLRLWLEDVGESRTCLVYGDGGYGKTTLVLEFLNKLLSGEVDIKSGAPEIISYHTAKMTKWTDQGITHFRGISTAVEDCIREVIFCLQDVLSKDWYKLEGDSLIDKVKGELAGQGYRRDDILLVLDNTETLASSTQDMEYLAEFFEAVSRKIGRVLITSRRREFVQATPIHVSALSAEESVRLLKRLAEEYKARALLQAGERRLRAVSEQLSFKPLLLDALVKYIARSGMGIDEGVSNIFKKSNDELLEFLYEDAWARMSELQRKVFMVLVSIACPVDSFSVGCICQVVGIQHTAFQEGLDETYFATMTSYGDSYELEIVELAANFFRQKLSKLSTSEREIIRDWARYTDEAAFEKEKIDKEYRSDRVAEAFRGQYAKAAKIAVEKGQNDTAYEYYELAIMDDPVNAALHDRYAWFLLNKYHRPDMALEMAKKATELDASNSDAHMTLALANYHLGSIPEGDKALRKANELGKPEALCLLRMGIGRYHHSKGVDDVKLARDLLEQASELIQRAGRVIRSKDGYYRKNRAEIEKYTILTAKALRNAR